MKDDQRLIDETRRHNRAIDVPIGNLVRKARADGHSIPCKRGCDACCYEPTFITHFELAPIVERLRQLSDAELQEIEQRIDAWHDGVIAAGLNPENVPESHDDMRTYHRAHLACPLLDLERHECRIYSDRPIACRGYYLLDQDPSACANRANVLTVRTINMGPVVAEPVFHFLHTWARLFRKDESVVVIEAMLAYWLRLLWPVVRDPSKSIVEWMLAFERGAIARDAIRTPGSARHVAKP